MRDTVGRSVSQLPSAVKFAQLHTYHRGRAALHAVLEALKVGTGDEVAIQAFTCVAVPLPIVALGAKPLYVDVDRRDFGMDVSDLESKLTPNTRAIVVQHTFGIPADIERVLAIAERRDIPVIEDCCHGFGATVGGREVGSFGVAAFYSFEWGKPLVAGLGGALLVNDPELGQCIAEQRSQLVPAPLRIRVTLELQYWAHHTLLGSRTYWILRDLYHRLSQSGLIVGTFEPGELHGEVGAQYHWRMAPRVEVRVRRGLEGLTKLVERHRKMAHSYQRGLQELGVQPYHPPAGRDPVYLFFPIQVGDKSTVMTLARKRRVPVSDLFRTPIHPLRADEGAKVGYQPGSCPVAEGLCETVVSLPVNSRLRPGDVSRVVQFIDDVKPAIR